jgi:hypothetical protein
MPETYTAPEILFTRAMLWHVLDLPYAEASKIMPALASMAALSEQLEARLHRIAESQQEEEKSLRMMFPLCGEHGRQLELIWATKPLAVFISALKACPGASVPERLHECFALAIRSAEQFNGLFVDLVRSVITEAGES